ncbi:MAG TPA: thymidylate synthase [Candidatus Aminicenantes bacterium]|nr:thymidylate synthase [Candidatus Aminicenantes bacterium]HPL13081.1 thymidylate synthase [Candidatus Aminicenantes bacterium]
MNGDIPALFVTGKTLPEAWENAVLACWRGGAAVRTEYDKPGDPPSRDCTMMWVVEEPFAEPRIHRAFPGGLEDLEIYRQEVVDGIHDHWIASEEGKWTYTYHKRLFAYETEGAVIDQIESLVEKLSRSGHSRRAQAITWNVALDPPTNDPPCLQRVWCRLLPGDGGSFVLNMNTHWRSRDGFKAAYMNVFALTELQKSIAGRIAERSGKEIRLGRYVDVADSFHIYGSYFRDFEGFLKLIEKRSFAERTWDSTYAEPMFVETREKLRREKAAKP